MSFSPGDVEAAISEDWADNEGVRQHCLALLTMSQLISCKDLAFFLDRASVPQISEDQMKALVYLSGDRARLLELFFVDNVGDLLDVEIARQALRTGENMDNIFPRWRFRHDHI